MKKLAFQFLKFGFVGLCGFIVDACFLTLGLHLLDLSRISAAFFSYPFAVTTTWAGNRFLTFRHGRYERPLRQWSKFAAACLLGILFNRGMYTFLVTTVPLAYEHPLLALIAGTLTGMIINFATAKTFVFRS